MLAEVKEMVIPLRAAWNVPRTKRANRAMAEIRNHVSQHMKIQEDEEICASEKKEYRYDFSYGKKYTW